MNTAPQPMTATLAVPGTVTKARNIRIARPDLRRMAIVIGLLVAQAVLAVVMRSMQGIATVHAAATTIICVGLAATTRRASTTATALGYLAGCEVLWRMTNAEVFWEMGKYAICLVTLIGLMRLRAPRRNRALAAGYFGLLLPSAILTLTTFTLELSRQQLSFNLSGPLSLALCVVFFSNIKLSQEEIRRVYFSLIIGVAGILTLAFISTITHTIRFSGESNFVTSGGFGPNQVSSMLGLALFLILLMLIDTKLPWAYRAPMIGLALMFAVQAALTFSRSGLALAFAGMGAALLYLVRDSRARLTLIIVAALLFAAAKYVIIPRLEDFTHGQIAERFSNSTSTNRGTLANGDLIIFKDNPALGVGPGLGLVARRRMGIYDAAHTEFTRMLAEHGSLGALALLLYLVLGIKAVRASQTVTSRAIVAGMVVWVTMLMAINGMRVAAPGFLFGLAFAVAYSSAPRASPTPQRRPTPS